LPCLPAGSTFRGNSPQGDEATSRWEFVGTQAPANIRVKYLGRSAVHRYAIARVRLQVNIYSGLIGSLGDKENHMSDINVKKFPKAVAGKLRYYVYLYIDPETNEVFYVGKGKGNRCFSHLDPKSNSPVGPILTEMRKRGIEPRIELLAHGLKNETAALAVEGAVIDLLGLDGLANQIRGQHPDHLGRMRLEEVMAIHQRRPAKIEHKVILIRINRLYHYGMSPMELYDATRGTWVVGERRTQAEYAFAVYHNIVREVYKIAEWLPAGSTFYAKRPKGDTATKRWEFVGTQAPEEIRKKYLGRSVDGEFKKYSRNPVQYVNC